MLEKKNKVNTMATSEIKRIVTKSKLHETKNGN